MRSLLIVFIGFFLITSCTDKIDGSGNIVTEVIPVSGFSRIELSVPARLNYSVGTEHSVEISAQQNIISVIDFVKSGDQLSIEIENNISLGTFKPITINITSPDISSLAINGSGSIYSESKIEATDLSLRIIGSGEFDLNEITVNELTGIIEGSGEMSVNGGTIENEKLTIDGSGNLKFSNVQSKNSVVKIIGSGTIRVRASDNLNVTISGSGTVHYTGSPVINSNISGSGQLIDQN